MLSEMAAARKDRAAGCNAKLEHRHFAFIAAVIKDLGMESSEQSYIAKCFAHACAATNPRFKTLRFLRACGVE